VRRCVRRLRRARGDVDSARYEALAIVGARPRLENRLPLRRRSAPPAGCRGGILRVERVPSRFHRSPYSRKCPSSRRTPPGLRGFAKPLRSGALVVGALPRSWTPYSAVGGAIVLARGCACRQAQRSGRDRLADLACRGFGGYLRRENLLSALFPSG